MVFAIPSLVKTLQAHRRSQSIHEVGYVYVERGLIGETLTSPITPNTECFTPQPNNNSTHRKKQTITQFDENGARIKRSYKRKTATPTISVGLQLQQSELKDNDRNLTANASNHKKYSDTEAENSQVSIPLCYSFVLFFRLLITTT